MFRLLFLLFVCVPLLELYLLIRVGSFLGAGPTIAICLFTAALGALLVRQQGLQTLARVQKKMQAGEVPAADLIGGMMILVAGVMLLTPGLFTDMIGFICLVPQFRDYVARAILVQALQRQAEQREQDSVIIEGEFWEDRDRKKLDDKD